MPKIAEPKEGTAESEAVGVIPEESIQDIPLEQIHEDRDGTKKSLPKSALEELAASIEENGVIQPLVVEPDGEAYKVVAGNCRLRAAEQAQLEKVPCIVRRNLTTMRRRALRLAENLCRRNPPVGEVFSELVDLYHDVIIETGTEAGAWKRVERMVGIGERRRQQVLKLQDLPADVQQQVIACHSGSSESGAITERHVRALVRLPTPGKQRKLFRRIWKENLSAAETQKIVQAELGPKKEIFSVEYSTAEELLEKLVIKVRELQAARDTKTAGPEPGSGPAVDNDRPLLGRLKGDGLGMDADDGRTDAEAAENDCAVAGEPGTAHERQREGDAQARPVARPRLPKTYS